MLCLVVLHFKNIFDYKKFEVNDMSTVSYNESTTLSNKQIMLVFIQWIGISFFFKKLNSTIFKLRIKGNL